MATTGEKDVILEIKVRYDEALEKIGQLKVANMKLKESQAALKKVDDP